MKLPLTLSNSQIISTVNRLFDVHVTRVNFLPVGESSWIYIAVDKNGQRNVVKAQKEVTPASVEIMGELMRQRYKWTPAVMFSKRGVVWEEVDGIYFSLQQYIEPSELKHADSMPSKVYLQQIGQLLKELHSIRVNDASIAHVKTETFEFTTATLAKKALAQLHSSSSDTQSVRTVRTMMAQQNGQIAQLFKNCYTLGAVLAEQKLPMSITHGDLHFGNVIESTQHHLYVVDWDHAMIAPREHDLMYFSDEQLVAISDGYGRNLLENKVAIRYYRNYLLIRALWFWLHKLLEAEAVEQPAIASSIVRIFDDSPYLLRALTE